MPLDLELAKTQQQQALDDLLKKRLAGVPGDIQGIQNQVEGTRDLISPTNQALTNLGVSGVATPQDQVKFQGNNLSRELAKQLSTTSLNRQRAVMGQQGQEVNRRANDAYSNRIQATGYANRQQALTSEQEFRAQQAELDRQAAEADQTMREQYNQAGIQQQNAAYDTLNNNSYESALTRLLAGAAGGIGTAMTLKKLYPQPEIINASSPATLTPYTVGASNRSPDYMPSNFNDYGYASSRVIDPRLNNFGR